MPDWQDDPSPFADLRPPAVEALARILYFKHTTITTGGGAPPKTEAACASWLHLQKRAVAGLHDVSIRRPRTLSLLGDVFFSARHSTAAHETLQADAAAALCPSHKRLNPRVLAALMALVADEATHRLDRVRAVLQQQRGDETAAVELWLRSAARIAALWMGKRRWEETMKRPLDVGLPPCARHGRCAACKLAVVGGSPQFLMDLRTSLVARHEHATSAAAATAAASGGRAPLPVEAPLLLRMVEAWIDVCYTRRRRRRIRRESDMLAGAVLRLRLGGTATTKKSVPSSRRTVRTAWPARISLMVEADIEELLGSGSDGDEDSGGGEYVVEYAPGRWQRCKSTSGKEGYSQYLPASAFAGPETSSAASARRPGELPKQQQPPSRNSTNRTKTNVPRAAAPPSPPPSPPASPPRASVHSEATNVAEPPWATADYDPPALAKPSPSLASAEADLAAIYDAYRSGGETASLGSPSASLFTRNMPAAAPGTVSPLTPSEYSSSPLDNAASAAPTMRAQPDEEVTDASLCPPPLRTRPRSGIPVPTRMAAGRTAVSRDSVQSMTSTILLGYGLCRRRRAL